MSEYNQLKQAMMGEWFMLQRRIHSGLEDSTPLIERCNHLEQVLQSEYGVEVRK